MWRKFIILVTLVSATKQSGCRINITTIETSRSPIILKSTFDVYYASDKILGNTVQIPKDEKFLISCGKENLTISHQPVDTKTVEASCNSQSQTEIAGQLRELRDVWCGGDVLEVTEETIEKCGENAKIVKVGFRLDTVNTLVTQYTVCFDYKLRNVLYTYHSISKNFGYGTHPVTRTLESDLDLYSPILLSAVYIGESIEKTINKLLGLPLDSGKYISRNETDDNFLYATQLSNFVNFFWRPQKLATFRYINTIPSWFNDFNNLNNNWATIQWDIFELITESNRDLDVYTGTFGIATLPHEETGEEIELFLYNNGDITAIPIPRLLWKLVYEPKHQAAVVLVTVNNPFQVKQEDIICEDISREIKFVHWNTDSVNLGYSYACTYEEFKEKVTFTPKMEVRRVFNAASKVRFSVLSLIFVSIVFLGIT